MDSLLVRFASIFFKKLGMKAKFLHIAIGLGGIAFAYERHRAADQFWEVAAPLVWVLSFSVVWHAIATAIRLNHEIVTRATERESFHGSDASDPSRNARNLGRLKAVWSKFCVLRGDRIDSRSGQTIDRRLQERGIVSSVPWTGLRNCEK